MSTLLWNVILPLLIILSTATPGAGKYYIDDPIDEVVEISAVAWNSPLTTGTLLEHLPDGARSVTIENRQYFVSSGNWFVAVYEGGIHYMVVLAPV